MRPSDFPTRMAWPNGFMAKRPSSGALGGGEVVNTGIVTGSLLSCFFGPLAPNILAHALAFDAGCWWDVGASERPVRGSRHRLQ